MIHSHRRDPFLQWHPHLSKVTVRFVMCERCGLVYQSPRLSSRELAELYRYRYRLTSPNETFLQGREAIAQERMDWLSRHLNGSLATTPFRVLEIGCSEGSFLARLQQRGWEVYGVEPSETFADYAREVRHLNVTQGLFHEGSFGQQLFNLVVCARVLEHVPDPVALLKIVHARLVPQGQVFIDVPNIYTPWDDLAKNFFASPHVVVFSPTTITSVLREAGLEPQVVDPQLPGYAKGMRIMARRGVEGGTSIKSVDDPREIRRILWQYQWKRRLLIGWKDSVKRGIVYLLGDRRGQGVIRRIRGCRVTDGIVSR